LGVARKIPTSVSLPPAPGKREQAKRWQDENREAIDEYNALVAERGVFSDGRRRF
jgi:post-segregation antitoxin (ccd killing protein)